MKNTIILPQKLVFILLLCIQSNQNLPADNFPSRKTFDKLCLPLSHRKKTKPLNTYDPCKESISITFFDPQSIYPYIQLRAPLHLNHLYRSCIICKTRDALEIKTNTVTSNYITTKNIDAHVQAIANMRTECIKDIRDLKNRTPDLNWISISYPNPFHVTKKQCLAALEKEMHKIKQYDNKKQNPKTILHRIRISPEIDQKRIKIVEDLYLLLMKKELFFTMLEAKQKQGCPLLFELAQITAEFAGILPPK